MDSSTVYSENCNYYLQNISTTLSSDELEKLSKKHNLIERKRVFNLEIAMKLFIYAAQNIKELSLIDYCVLVERETGKPITKQAMAERFSQKSVDFANALLAEVLKSQLKTSAIKPRKFKKIFLIDSTGFKLPPNLSHIFKGHGGSDLGSGLKIQYAYDLISGKISLFDLTNGTTSDYSYSKTQTIDKDALYIQDLGYFTKAGFEKIQAEGGYFISRFHHQCGLYESQDKDEDTIDFIALVATFLSFAKPSLSRTYYISLNRNKSKKLQIRLVMFAAPEKVVKKRMAKRVKKGKKQANCSEATKANNKVSFYITNVPEDILSDEQIRKGYHLRWAIELTFKIWKSIFKLNEIKDMSPWRFLTLFYFKLILILIDFQVVTSIVKQAKRRNINLSLYTCCAVFKKHFRQDFHEHLLNNRQKELSMLLIKMASFMEKNCRTSQNKNRISLDDYLAFFCLRKQEKDNPRKILRLKKRSKKAEQTFNFMASTA